MAFTQEEKDYYTSLGYTQEDLNRIEKNQQLSQVNSMFSQQPNENLVKYQLEFNDILERIEHILRGDEISIKDGNVIWKTCKTKEKRLFNDHGVAEIMRLLCMYLTRNTILSDYKDDEIKAKVYDIGVRLNDLIFMNYEVFGLDTQEKKKKYFMIVGQIVDIIHSAYNRAKDGGERTSLREARQITQSESLSTQQSNIQTKRHLLDPRNLIP